MNYRFFLIFLVCLNILCLPICLAQEKITPPEPPAGGQRPVSKSYRFRYLRSIDAKGSGYPLSNITRLFFDDFHKELYIMDDNAGRSVITDDWGIPLHTFKYYVDANLNRESPVTGIAADREGNVYMAEEKRVVVLDYRGKYRRDIDLSVIPDSASRAIQSITVDKESRLYVGMNKKLAVLDREEKFLFQITSDKNANFLNAASVAADKDGIYILDTALFRVFRFNREGKYISAFGQISSLPGGFSMPVSITVDERRGWVIVVDTNRYAVIFFDREGNYLFEFGGPELFNWPHAIAVNNKGWIYVADATQKIRVFTVIEEEPEPTPPPVAAALPSPAPEPPKDRVAMMAETKGMLLPVYFHEGSVEFKAADGEILDNNIKWLKENPDAKLDIRGYADDRQSEESNLILSEERAKAANDYMTSRGIDQKRLSFKGYGKASTGAGDADMPRKRVDFLLVK